MANIKNIDALDLSDEEKERLEKMLQDALQDSTEDVELRGYLMEFIDPSDGEMSLDAQEVWQAQVIRDRFEEYSLATPSMSEGDSILSQFGDLGEFSGSELGSPTAEDLESPVAAPAWDEPLPESTLEVPEAFNSASSTDSASELDGMEEAEPSLQVDPVTSDNPTPTDSRIPFPESPQSTPVPTADEADDRALKYIQAMAPLMGGGQGGGGGSAEPSAGGIAQAGAWAAKSGYNLLKGGAGAFAGATAGATGATLGAIGGTLSYVGKGTYHAGVKAAPYAKQAASATSDKVTSLAKKLRGALSGKGSRLSSDELSQLRGEPQPDNVVDIRQRLGDRIGSMNKDSVQRQVELMRDQQLLGKSNALLSTMEGIDKGAPNGRYSEIDVAEGLSLGAVLNAAQNNDPTVAAMAKSTLANSDVLDAANEMEFLSCEYQEVADALESTIEQAQKQGWSDEEIAAQYGAPIEEWLERRMEEDQQLAELANLQDNNLTPEEISERQNAMEKMAESIKKMLDKLFGRDRDNDQSSGMSMSR
jgi:hypothetical protein|tara:strand:+ start:1420 stop:3018 length:1599 start_codon:yes stop_codon:yes gene_type:complete